MAEDRRRYEKIISLGEAVRKSIRPGMRLHFSIGAEANASVREIARQYWGRIRNSR